MLVPVARLKLAPSQIPDVSWHDLRSCVHCEQGIIGEGYSSLAAGQQPDEDDFAFHGEHHERTPLIAVTLYSVLCKAAPAP